MTPFKEVHEAFFHKIEEDVDFFAYHNLTPEQCMELANERAESYRRQAVALVYRRCELEFDIYSQDQAHFTETLTHYEVELLSSLMLQFYLQGRMARLKAFELNFVPADLKVFSPAEDRRSFLELYRTLCRQNGEMLDGYNSKTRDGKTRELPYDSYAANFEEG